MPDFIFLTKSHYNLLLQELDNLNNKQCCLDKSSGCYKNIKKMLREKITSFSAGIEISVKEMSSGEGKLIKVHDFIPLHVFISISLPLKWDTFFYSTKFSILIP